MKRIGFAVAIACATGLLAGIVLDVPVPTWSVVALYLLVWTALGAAPGLRRRRA